MSELEVLDLPDPANEVPSTTDGIAIRAIGLTKRYGQLLAVNDVDLEVPAGSVFGLIGPNGAGKSTTFSVLATLLEPTSGSVSIFGHNPVHEPFAVREKLGYMPDVLGVYDNLTVQEYLEFFAAAYRLPRRTWPALISGLLELVDLEVKVRTMVDDLSRGMKQRLSLARALVHDPSVLVLDEPASGLDPRARIELRGLISELSGMGKTIVISSHILAELEEMCTDVAIMEAGQLVASGTPSDIRRQLEGGRRIVVRLAGGEEQEYVVADEAEQQELLRRLLIEEELPVVAFNERAAGLEDIFLRVTKGIVQ